MGSYWSHPAGESTSGEGHSHGKGLCGEGGAGNHGAYEATIQSWGKWDAGHLGRPPGPGSHRTLARKQGDASGGGCSERVPDVYIA